MVLPLIKTSVTKNQALVYFALLVLKTKFFDKQFDACGFAYAKLLTNTLD